MHSSHLRGRDFMIETLSQRQNHAAYFAGFHPNRRLGLVTPEGVEGVGAMVLIMAYVTAFYDTYRSTGEPFYAYPEFFTFQSCTPLASYTMLDIWPPHKDVFVEPDPAARLNALTDRGIQILLVPDKEPQPFEFHPAQLESARRTIDCCYLYSRDGQIENADLTITSAHPAFGEWGDAVLETPGLIQTPTVEAVNAWWQNRPAGGLCQSFRKITLEEALRRL